MRKFVKLIIFCAILPLGLVGYFLLFCTTEEETNLEKVAEDGIVPTRSKMILQSPQLSSTLSSSSSSCEVFISPSNPRKECGCVLKKYETAEQEVVAEQCSMCSDEADLLGPGQRVISYSFYKSKYRTRSNKNPKTNYYRGISRNLKAMRELYPGWVMRVYSNHTLTPGDETCNLICENQEDLYWCDARKIKNPGDPSVSAHHLHGMFWRFFPMIDPLVQIFLSRDLDCLLGLRESNAVKEWEERKDKAIHLMRDYPYHKRYVLGGMWGMKNDDGLIKPKKREELLTKLIELESTKIPGVDQYALKEVVYAPDYFPLILAHDSFLCELFNKTECIPFPDGGWTLDHPVSFVGKTHIF